MSVTIDEVKRTAELAKLQFTDEEILDLTSELSPILDYVSQVNECDTTGIEFEHNLSDYSDEVLQEDVVREKQYGKKLLSNATDGREQNGYARVSKIINKD